MFLSVIIPAYNEEKRLPATLETVLDYLKRKKFTFEVIIVDDGSQDGTKKSLSHFRHNEQVKLISYEKNQGKGYAIQQGVSKAEGDLILFLDADHATPIEELDRFLPHIEQNEVVIGSRYIKGSDIQRKQPLARRIIGRLGNLFIQVFFLPKIKDTQCGFKLFHTTCAKILFQDLQIKRFGFDIEILYKARKKGFAIHEVPVSWLHMGESRLRPFRDSLRTLFDLLLLRIS